MPMSESEKVIRTLYEITADSRKGFEYQIQKLLQLGCERFGLDIGILAKIEGSQYEVQYKFCPDNIPLRQGDLFNLGETYCSITLKADRPVGIEHVKESDRNKHPAYDKFGLESYIGVPVKLDGKVYGTLNFSSPAPRERKFQDIDVDALQLMASWVSTELSRLHYVDQLKRANSQLEILVTRDSLTNLNNRRSFQSKIEQLANLSRRGHTPLSIVLLDIDHFKDYNDKYGHLDGDHILVELADILTKNCRDSDVIARFGGEEFAILLHNTNRQGAQQLCSEILQSLETHSWEKDKITASFGIATQLIDQLDDRPLQDICTEIIRRADTALYYSKEHGRNQVRHFDDIK